MSKATALINAIAMSRIHFDGVIADRRDRLAMRNVWRSLAEDYQNTRRRYEQRFRKPLHRKHPFRINPTDCAFDLDEKGKPISNTFNALLCLREHPALSGIICTDHTGRLILQAPLPLAFYESLSFTERGVTRADVTAIQEFLQMVGLSTIERHDVEGAIKLIAREYQRGAMQ